MNKKLNLNCFDCNKSLGECTCTKDTVDINYIDSFSVTKSEFETFRDFNKQETLEHKSKFIVFTLQDSEDWVQHSIPLDSFEKADNFCQQFRDKKMSYLICQTLKQGYNGK